MTTAAGPAVGPIDVTFTVPLERSTAPGGWTYVVMPGSAEYFGTRGLVRVAGTVEGEPFSSALMALGDGRHKLPVTAAIVRRIGRATGEDVTVHLTQRRP